MASVFTLILSGEIPATFVHRDELSAAFMSINPIRPGHTLVIPVVEVEHWVDLDPEISTHLFDLARRIGSAITSAFHPVKVGLVIAGYEIAHTHLHVIPTWSMADLDFRNAQASVDRAELEDAAERIRAHL